MVATCGDLERTNVQSCQVVVLLLTHLVNKGLGQLIYNI